MIEQYANPHEQYPNFADLSDGAPHQISRFDINAKLVRIAEHDCGVTPSRVSVPAEYISWDIDFPGYQPAFVDLPRGHSSFRKEGDQPDPDNPHDIPYFTSLEVTNVLRDESGAPRNPLGRTGMAGRGMLDKWGPTPAADLVLLRTNPDTGELETLLINRGDTGELAFPGGKVDEGEDPRQTAVREIIEETGLKSERPLDFSGAVIVYQGYVDDSRNTDNAWMETTVLYH
ncbi:MAG: NUDIX domain-containing protein [Candidatus Saccharibacteria bacterium]